MARGSISGDGAARRWTRRRWAWLLPLLIGGTWWAWAVGSKAATMRAYSIPSNSMVPALQSGDRVAVQSPPDGAPKRGEVWVMRAPPSASAVPAEYVKRVMGLPGETIEVRRGVLWIDGKPINEPYLTRPFTYSLPPRSLGPGEYFVLGDDRDASNDSHRWGPLPERYLVGPVNYRIWPPQRIKGF